MKKIILIGLMILFLGKVSVSAQISISGQDFAQIFLNEFTMTTGNALELELEDVEDLINTSGQNQTWDFRGLEINEFLVGFFKGQVGIEGTPGVDEEYFQQATHTLGFEISQEEDGASILLKSYLYADFTPSRLISLGSDAITTMDIGNGEQTFSFRSKYIPGSLDYDFPLTYGKTWNTTYTEETSFGNYEITTVYEIDGWGTVLTDAGSFPVLRVKELTTEIDLDEEYSYEAYTFYTSAGLPIADIDYDIEFDEYNITVFSFEMNTSVENETDVPVAFQLNQNYPNPFNPATSITYELDQAAPVILEVFNIAGQKIATLVNERQNSGSHSVSFNATDLSSGVYLYRITVNGVVQTRKMTLVK